MQQNLQSTSPLLFALVWGAGAHRAAPEVVQIPGRRQRWSEAPRTLRTGLFQEPR